MNRRRFLLTSLAGAFAAPLAAAAPPTGDAPRVGTLSLSPPTPDVKRVWESFFQGLRDHGYVLGENIIIEQRWAEGKSERLVELTSELVRLPADILVTAGTPATLAARKVTGTIPIVMMFVADPVELGIVASLARPGGNVTGTAWLFDDLGAKQLELLREVVPGLSRAAVLWHATNPGQSLPRVQAMERAARTVGITLEKLGIHGPRDFDGVFGAMINRRVEAFLVAGDPFMYLHRARIARLALQHRLPAAFSLRQFTEVGGLLSYAPSLTDSLRHAAIYVDKIVRGAKPADLPVERPTKFDLVINLKTAEALGLTIRPSLRLRADRVIE